MRKLTFLLVGLFCLPAILLSQEKESEKYSMVQLDYIKPKVGMEKKFTDAVKAHNEEYHPDGPYSSGLYYIATGNEAGWFVWVMGPLTYTQLDDAPGPGDHMEDWRKRVSPYVQDYGRIEYWKLADKLSRFNDTSEPIEEMWFLDIKRGDWYRFKAFMEKVYTIHENMDEEIQVWMNQYSQGDGRDVAISWPMENWAVMDKHEWKMAEEYNKEFGEGAWQQALDEWEEVVENIKQEVWYNVMED